MKPDAKQMLADWSLLIKTLTPIALSAAVYSLSTNTIAQAEAPTQRAGSQFEEVLVTARRKEEDLQTVPIAITAMSGEYLRENNITQLESIASHVPSLDISVGGSSTNTPIISLRGQRPSETLISLDAAIPLYFADVVLTPTMGTNISLYDLGNVQVLKGPQGTLFGRNSTGGAVIFTPQAPGNEFGGYLETRVGDYDLLGFEGAVDIPVSDRFRMRLAGTKLDRDGYQENVANNALHGKDYWDEHSKGLRFSIDIDITDNLRNLLVLDWSTNDMQSRVITPLGYNGNSTSSGFCSFCQDNGVDFWMNQTRIFGGTVYPWGGQFEAAIARQRGRSWQEVETDYDAREKVTNEIAANTTTLDINSNLTFKNILAYRKLDFKYQFDTDGTALAGFGSRTTGQSNGDIFAVTYAGEFPYSIVLSEQFTEELQLIVNGFDDRLELIVGAYYFEMEATETKPSQIAPVQDQWRNSPQGDAENKSAALFTEGTFDFNAEFALTLGLRYTRDERKIVAKSTKFSSAGLECLVKRAGSLESLPIEQCAREASETFSAPTWRVIGTYTPMDGTMYYGSVSTGYRSGGFNLRAEEDFQFEPFDEEEVTNYEIGSKIDWVFDSGLAIRMSASAFWQDYTDIQKTVVSPDSSTGFGTVTINAAKAVIRGADLELQLIPTEGLIFGLSYVYIDAYYEKWLAPNTAPSIPGEPPPPEFIDQSDFDFLEVPEYSGTASISYLLPFDQDLGDIKLKFHYSYQSKVVVYEDLEGEFSFDGIDNQPLNESRTADSYYLMDFRIDWSDVMMSSFDAAVWIKNIENKAYRTGSLILPDSLGFFATTYGAPRTIGASLRYRF